MKRLTQPEAVGLFALNSGDPIPPSASSLQQLVKRGFANPDGTITPEGYTAFQRWAGTPLRPVVRDNPIAADSSYDGPIVLGSRVAVDIYDDANEPDADAIRRVKPPASFGMVHDDSGHQWGKNSLLIAPFSKTGREIEDPSRRIKEWFGGTSGRLGDLKFPPKDGWETGGERVYAVWYLREGEREPGPFVHHVKRKSFPFFGKEIKVWLRRRGELLRIDFPDGLVVDWRGIREA